MTPLDMQAWSAARIVGEAAARTRSADPAKLIAFIKGPDFSLAAFKGQKLTLRDWNLQLRQPILLFDGRNTVSVSPQEGFLHQILRARHARRGPAGDEMQIELRNRHQRCHSRASGNRECTTRSPGAAWIPACAGMTRALVLSLALLLIVANPAFAYLAFVSNEKGNTISVVDTDKMETVATIPTGQRPRGIDGLA